jgi:hypothetical protein
MIGATAGRLLVMALRILPQHYRDCHNYGDSYD